MCRLKEPHRRACNFPLSQVVVVKESIEGRYRQAIRTGDRGRRNDSEQGNLEL